MLILVSLLLSAGAVCPFSWEGSKAQWPLWSRVGAACVPAWTAGVGAPDSPPWMSPLSLLPVTAWCGEHGLLVLVKPGLLGTERPVRAVELTLGLAHCPSVWMDTETNVTLFHCHLLDCDIAVMVFVHQLLYSTHLNLVPREVGSAVEKSRMAIASIECHDPRKVNVDWQMGLPRTPLIPLRAKGGLVQYSLRLMNADWTAERTSKIYRQGDFIHVEMSVTVGYAPMRLYVDRCAAIPSLDHDFTPRYHLIGFNGCLLDSRFADSLSSFVSPRAHQDQLQIKLDTFWIPDAHSSISIVCHLKAVATDTKPDSINKACTFKKPGNQWIPVEGPAGICACCNQGNCSGGRRRQSTGFGWKARASQFDEQLQKEEEVWIGPLQIVPADLRDPGRRAQQGNHNRSRGEEALRHNDVHTKTLLIFVGLAGAVALLISALVIGCAVCCGALTIFNLYNKLAKPSAWRRG